jgi:hypothetical protein
MADEPWGPDLIAIGGKRQGGAFQGRILLERISGLGVVDLRIDCAVSGKCILDKNATLYLISALSRMLASPGI